MSDILYLLSEAKTEEQINNIVRYFRVVFEEKPLLYCNVAAALKRVRTVKKMARKHTEIQYLN